MKKQFQNVNLNYLSAVFLSSMLGSLSVTALMQQLTEPGESLSFIARAGITLIAIVLFAAVVGTTFYIVVPEFRPILRRLFRK